MVVFLYSLLSSVEQLLGHLLMTGFMLDVSRV